MNNKLPTFRKLIKDAENIPISDDDILLINPKTRIVLYDDLERLYQNNQSIMDLFTENDTINLLYQLRDTNHWVCLIYNRDLDVFFFYNSYALIVDAEIDLFTHRDKYLTKLLQQTGKKIITNTKRVQEFKDDIATCGRHSALRSLFHKYSNEQYNNLIMKFPSINRPDEFVSALTILPLQHYLKEEHIF